MNDERDCYGSAETILAFGDAMAQRAADGHLAESDAEAQMVCAAWRKWARSPDAFAAQSLCEAVGWRR